MTTYQYSQRQRLKNQRTIIVTTASIAGFLLLCGLLQAWPVMSYVAMAIVFAPIVYASWSLFASAKATRITEEPSSNDAEAGSVIDLRGDSK